MKHNEIISCLRNPCGDRIRKINNVNIVLEVAKNKGIDLESSFIFYGILSKTSNLPINHFNYPLNFVLCSN